MTIVTWPESQDLFECANYKEHSKLINGDIGLKIYGSCAYLVEKEWWEGDIDPIDDDDNDEELEICYDDELLGLGFLSEDDFEDDEDNFEDEEDDDIEL